MCRDTFGLTHMQGENLQLSLGNSCAVCFSQLSITESVESNQINTHASKIWTLFSSHKTKMEDALLICFFFNWWLFFYFYSTDCIVHIVTYFGKLQIYIAETQVKCEVLNIILSRNIVEM